GIWYGWSRQPPERTGLTGPADTGRTEQGGTGPSKGSVELPLHWEKSANPQFEVKVVSLGKKQYYDHIAYVLEDGTRIPFVLIANRPQTTGVGLEVKPFYFMVNKVSVGLYRKFTQTGLVPQEEWFNQNAWQKGPQDDDFPVMATGVLGAYHFANK